MCYKPDCRNSLPSAQSLLTIVSKFHCKVPCSRWKSHVSSDSLWTDSDAQKKETEKHENVTGSRCNVSFLCFLLILYLWKHTSMQREGGYNWFCKEFRNCCRKSDIFSGFTVLVDKYFYKIKLMWCSQIRWNLSHFPRQVFTLGT